MDSLLRWTITGEGIYPTLLWTIGKTRGDSYATPDQMLASKGESNGENSSEKNVDDHANNISRSTEVHKTSKLFRCH